MASRCNPGKFEVRRSNCPDCKRSIDAVEYGYQQCNKCLQFVKFDNWTPVKAIPKELM